MSNYFCSAFFSFNAWNIEMCGFWILSKKQQLRKYKVLMTVMVALIAQLNLLSET